MDKMIEQEFHTSIASFENITIETPAGFVAKTEVSNAPTGDITIETPVSAPVKPVVKHHMGMKAASTISNTIIYILLVLISVVWVIPFICLVLQSFDVSVTSIHNWVIPKEWGIEHYRRLFMETSFPKWFLNTFLMGLAVAVIQTIFVLATSYSLSRFRFKGRKLLMNLMLVLGMFPGFLTMILLYKVMSDLNLTGANAPIGLVIVYVASSGMGYYVSKGFFDTVPKALDEAAKVDGATGFQIFYKIILPMAKPIVIYTILTAFMAPWGDYIFAGYMSHGTAGGQNVAVGLQSWMGSIALSASNYGMFCAGGIIVAIPITLLFMFLQKYYVEGVTGGAVKG